MSINKAIILGNVGKDPDVRDSPSGAAFASFAIATSEKWRDKDSGETQERSEWHNCKAFGKTAEIVGKYVRKGSKVYVEGQIRTEKWQDKNGADRYTTNIIIDKLELCDKPQARAEIPAANRSPHNPQMSVDDFDDQIPF